MIIVGWHGRSRSAPSSAPFCSISPSFFLEPIVGHGYLVIFGILVVLAILYQPAGLAGL